MGQYRITSPDGQEFEITAPEGASESEILDYAKRNFSMMPKAQATKPMSDNGARWGALDNFSSGILQGMGDEVKALTQATRESAPRWLGGNDGLSFGNAYNQAKIMYQGARNKYTKENPKTAFATDLAGQMLPWAAAAPFMPAMTATSLTGRMAQAGALGAGTGAVSGGLNAEGDMMDRAKGAVTGAAIGAGTGAVAVPVMDALSKGAQYVANQAISKFGSPFQQEKMAARKVAEALIRDGMTPDQAAARVAQMGPEAALMDVGTNTRGLARSAGTVPGEGRTAITDFLRSRQEGVRDANGVLQGGQINRITNQINALVPEDFYATQQGLAARNAQGPLYREAFAANKDMASPAIDRILETPAGRDALAYARERMQNRMSLMATPDVDLTDQMRLLAEIGKMDRVPIGVSKGLKLETLDLVKQGLDDAYRATERKVINGTARQGELRDLASLKSAFVRELDAADVTAQAGPNSTRPDGGAYARARALASDKFRNQEALETGTTFMSRSEFQNPRELADSLAGMNAEQLHNFRIGAAQALKQKIGDLNTRSDATKRLMDVPALEQKIRLAFGDDQTFSRYIRGLENERAMFDSYGKILGNSRTGEVLAEQADAAVDPSRIIQGMQQLASGSYGSGLLNVAGGLKDRAFMTEPMSRNLGQMLTGRNVGPLNQAYQQAQLSEDMKRRIAQYLATTGGVGGGIAQGR